MNLTIYDSWNVQRNHFEITFKFIDILSFQINFLHHHPGNVEMFKLLEIPARVSAFFESQINATTYWMDNPVQNLQ